VRAKAKSCWPHGQVREGDPLEALAAERAEHTGPSAIHHLIRDALGYGDRELLYRSTPGTSPEARRGAFERWARQHYPGDDPRQGEVITSALIEHGYFLHRLFEFRPELAWMVGD
jgi:hypothetical protein